VCSPIVTQRSLVSPSAGSICVGVLGCKVVTVVAFRVALEAKHFTGVRNSCIAKHRYIDVVVYLS